MIYLEVSEEKHIIILNDRDIRELRKGEPAFVPGGKVMLGFTRDQDHTFGMIESMTKTTGQLIDIDLLKFIFEEGAKVKKCSSKTAKGAGNEPSSSK